jgi:HK97 family phage major capsid protein
MFRDATVGKIRGITDTTGQPIWTPTMIPGQPDRLLGYQVIEDPAIAAMATGVVTGIFGDFSGFVIRDVGQMRFERSDDFAFDADLISFRAVMRTDSDVLDTRSLRVYRGGTA